jgi:hypothetical protein
MVIDAIRYTEDPSRAPLTAESLLKDMLLQQDKNKDASISPNRVTISSILHLWFRSGLREAPQRVEQHLATLKEWWYKQESKSNNSGQYREIRKMAPFIFQQRGKYPEAKLYVLQ